LNIFQVCSKSQILSSQNISLDDNITKMALKDANNKIYLYIGFSCQNASFCTTKTVHAIVINRTYTVNGMIFCYLKTL